MITDDMTLEDKTAYFEQRVGRGEKVEPHDWMPDGYRRQLIRLIHQHANSEIVGALPEGKWIPYAPTLKRKLALIAKVQDEVGHAQLLYRAAETLGKPREEMIDELLSGKSKYSNIFNYPAETWADVAVIAWLVDAAAIINQTLLSEGSYGPYARALKRICYEEAFHLKHGHDMCVTLAAGTPAQRAMLQDALNRWWWPLMMFHGPSDTLSTHTAQLIKWRVKLMTNDEIRQEFLRRYVPQIQRLGLTIPDPELRYDRATDTWLHGPIDWDEFFRVINGDGPCNKERLAARNLAHEQGAWVRTALADFLARREEQAKVV